MRLALTPALVAVALAAGSRPAGATDTPWQPDLEAGERAAQNQAFLEAEERLVEALGKTENIEASDPTVAVILDRLAAVQHEHELDPQAEARYMAAAAAARQSGNEHTDLAMALNRVGDIYRDHKRIDEAETILRRALAISDRWISPCAPEGNPYRKAARTTAAVSLRAIGRIVESRHLYADAERFYQRAEQLIEEAYGPDSIEQAQVLLDMGRLYSLAKVPHEAIPRLEWAVSILERQWGDSEDLATVLNLLAVAFVDDKDPGGAERVLRRMLAIHETVLGLDDPKVADVLDRLAPILMSTHRTEDAQELSERSRAIRLKAEMKAQGKLD